jgi:hypothetical protein
MMACLPCRRVLPSHFIFRRSSGASAKRYGGIENVAWAMASETSEIVIIFSCRMHDVAGRRNRQSDCRRLYSPIAGVRFST